MNNIKSSFQEFLIKQGYKITTPSGNPSTVYDYKKRIDFIGKKIILTQRDIAPKEEYIAQDIDNFGNLVVKDKNGIIKTLFSGDLIL